MSYFPVTPQSLGAFHSLVAPSSLPYDADEHQLPPHFRHFDQYECDDAHDDPTASPSPSCYAPAASASLCHPSIPVIHTIVEDDSDHDSDSLDHHANLAVVNELASLRHVSASMKSTSLSVSANHLTLSTATTNVVAPARRVHSMPLLHSALTSSPTSSSPSSSSAVCKFKFGHSVSAPISIPTSSVNYHAYSPSCRAAANVYPIASSSDKSLTPPRPFIHRRDRDIPYACRRSNYHTASFIEQKDKFILDGAAITSAQHHDPLVNEEKSVERDDDQQDEETRVSWGNTVDGLFVCEDDIVPPFSHSPSNDEYIVGSTFAKKQQRQAANQCLQMFPL